MPGAFQAIQHWPPGPYPSHEDHDNAEQALIETSLTWKLDGLFRVREAVGTLFHDMSAQDLQARLPLIAKALKTALPNATLDLIRGDLRALGAAPMARFLSQIEQVHPDIINQAYQAEDTTYGAPYYFFHPAPHYELLANINFPLTFAFGIRLGLEAYLIVDFGQEVTLEPLEASERRARDIGARLLMTPRADVFSTSRFPRLTPNRRHFLRAWITARLNYLYVQLAGLHAAPVKADGCIDTGPLWKDLLTLEDILALTQLIATSSDPALRRLLFFDLMDRYAELGGSPGRKVSDLLNDQHIARILEALDPDLHDTRPILDEYIRGAWQRVCNDLWSGVLDPAAREAGTLNIQAPNEPPEVLSKTEFTPRMMYALRNTTHGYHLHKMAFEQFLTRHSGMLPDAVRELAIGLWFGLLSSPSVYWPSAERFGRYARVGNIAD
jgi:hypothetical protein